MMYRRRGLRSVVTAGLTIALIVLAADAAICADSPEISPEGACAAIRRDVGHVARVERAEADALELAGHGADMASVATQLDELLAKVSDLRITLHKVSQSRLTHDPDVANCLKLGYRALYEAEKLTTEVEQILLQQTGHAASSEKRRDENRPRAA